MSTLKNSFSLISFEDISVLNSNLTHRYTIIKQRSSSKKGKINPLLWELWPFFTFKRCFPSDIFFLKKIDLSLLSTSFFAKYLRVVKDGPGRGHLCHTDTFLVDY